MYPSLLQCSPDGRRRPRGPCTNVSQPVHHLGQGPFLDADNHEFGASGAWRRPNCAACLLASVLPVLAHLACTSAYRGPQSPIRGLRSCTLTPEARPNATRNRCCEAGRAASPVGTQTQRAALHQLHRSSRVGWSASSDSLDRKHAAAAACVKYFNLQS